MKYRRQLIAVSIAAAAAVVSYGLTTLQFFDSMFGEAERKTVDYRMRSGQVENRDSINIVLLLFDKATTAEWDYLSPFPRAALADLLKTVANNGATVIGLDVLLDRQFPVLSAVDSGDQRLRDAIRDAGNVVLAAETQQVGTTRVLIPPDPMFAEVAAAVAAVEMPTPFETVREATLIMPTDRGLMPGFPLALYAIDRGLDLDSLMKATEQKGRLELSGLPALALVPGEPLSVPVRFAGPPSNPDRETGAFRAYSAGLIRNVGVATQFAPSEGVRTMVGGSAVLMGSGFHMEERFRSPFYELVFEDSAHKGEIAGWTYGVEMHANALQNLLYGRSLKPLGGAATFALLFLVALLASGATFWRGAKWGALVPALGLMFVAYGALEAFARADLILPMVGTTLAGVLAFTSASAYVSVVEGREKRMIRGAFSKYVPSDVVDDLVADPTKLKLGGEKRTVSILFSDVAGFTSMSEVLTPETLVSVLNEYLDEMSDIVFDEKGTLDKYIGDAVMAFWNAPAPVPDHALRCCRTALRMQTRLGQMNEEWKQNGKEWPALHIRIGLNTGTPVVGNIGGDKKFQYTALGDAVNLAARLEPACKGYGVAIMIGEATRVEAGDWIQVRELDMLAVYGKAEPVRVYELLGLADDKLDEVLEEALGHYEHGLDAYRRRDFELAVQYFRAALEVCPDDGPSELYLDRSEECIVNPPPADWDFVERRQVK